MCVLLQARAAIYKKRFSGSSAGFPKAFTFFHLWSHSTLLYEADAVQKHLSKFEKERLNVWGKNCSIVPPLCADEVGAVPEEGVTLLVPQEGAKGRGQVIVHVPWDNPSTQKNFIVFFCHKICQDMFRSHYCAFRILLFHSKCWRPTQPRSCGKSLSWNPTWLLFNAISAGEFAKRLKVKSFDEWFFWTSPS